MAARKVSVPSHAAIGDYLPDADFGDAYEVSVPTSDQTPEESFHAIMDSMPDWFRRLFKLRNTLVRPLGLTAPSAVDIDQMTAKKSYSPGDRIGVFQYFGRTDNEVVTGLDDKHLDFRLSVLRTKGNEHDKVAIITLVKRNNFAGRAYLRTIMPFHEIGARTILQNAATAGKL